MKLLFSESKADYSHYIFPYAIWAFLEPGESPSDCFEHGFLPSSYNLDRFYLCRQIRIRLASFAPSSENRRIMRKCDGIQADLIPRSEFEFTSEKRAAFKHYADIKFGKDVMTTEKLDLLFNSALASHMLVFTDSADGREVGTVVIYLEPNRTAFYYYAFYDLTYYERNLGIYMMTTAIAHLKESGIGHLYLGTCYTRNALYKAQFAGAQFFNGFEWSTNLKELKYLVHRDQRATDHHLLESADYRGKFKSRPLQEFAAESPFATVGISELKIPEPASKAPRKSSRPCGNL